MSSKYYQHKLEVQRKAGLMTREQVEAWIAQESNDCVRIWLWQAINS